MYVLTWVDFWSLKVCLGQAVPVVSMDITTTKQQSLYIPAHGILLPYNELWLAERFTLGALMLSEVCAWRCVSRHVCQ